MTDIVLMKTAGGALVPADPQAAEYIAKLKLGAGVRATIVRQNNLQFHRKFFALLNLGFEAWEPGELLYKGVPVAKQFDQFRKDIVILAGFYTSVVNFRGEVRLVAKSLSFASMPQEEREALYSAVINVLLSRVLTQYTREDLDNVVEQILGFA